MNFFTALILGVIQGATEFLPVSSSGHIVLLCRITGIDASVSLSLILHLATVLAVCIAFREKLWQLIKKPFCPTTLYLFIATAISAVIALLLKPVAESFMDGRSLALFFLISAVILTLATLFPCKNAGEMNIARAVVIGVSQGLAVFPGLSRSATTISTGSLLGVEQKHNTEFCFLLSVPIIIGSAIVDIFTSPVFLGDFTTLSVSFVSALISGIFALKLIKSGFWKKSKYFIVYLVTISALITLNDSFLHLF